MSRQRVAVQQLATDVVRSNLLVNGGLKNWQRGNGPFTAFGAYTSDRWSLTINGASTASATNVNSSVSIGGDGGSACQVVATYNNGQVVLGQTLKMSDNTSFYALRGKQVSASARVFANGPNVQFGITSDGTGATFALVGHAGNSLWSTLTATYAVPVDATYVSVYGLLFGASATGAVENVMLTAGGLASDYVAVPAADELARGLRYYEVIAPSPGLNWWIGYASLAAQNIFQPLYTVLKAVAPTVTKAGNWTLTNSTTGPSINNVGRNSISIYVTSTAAGQLGAYPTDASGVIISEANP